jgi:hypothetical protein
MTGCGPATAAADRPIGNAVSGATGQNSGNDTYDTSDQ